MHRNKVIFEGANEISGKWTLSYNVAIITLGRIIQHIHLEI